MFRTIFFRPDEGAGTEGDGNEGEGGTQETTPPKPKPSAGNEGGAGSSSEEDLVPRADLQKANAEAAARRKELREAEKRIADLEGQSKTEAERAADRATKAEAEAKEANERVRNLRVQVLAPSVGIVESARADAAQLLDWSTISDPNDDEAVTSALEDLVKAKPYLLGGVAGGADGGAGGDRSGGVRDMNAEIRAAAGK
jgi:hypothetical protein